MSRYIQVLDSFKQQLTIDRQRAHCTRPKAEQKKGICGGNLYGAVARVFTHGELESRGEVVDDVVRVRGQSAEQF